jgi:hypothetical protein
MIQRGKVFNTALNDSTCGAFNATLNDSTCGAFNEALNDSTCVLKRNNFRNTVTYSKNT